MGVDDALMLSRDQPVTHTDPSGPVILFVLSKTYCNHHINMWTLHKLNNRTLRHNNCDNSKAPPGRVELSTHPPDIPWEFEERDLLKFPALRKRNFFCIQRHQARALHYDLRLQLDGGTISWAIPRGLIGKNPGPAPITLKS